MHLSVKAQKMNTETCTTWQPRFEQNRAPIWNDFGIDREVILSTLIGLPGVIHQKKKCKLDWVGKDVQN